MKRVSEPRPRETSAEFVGREQSLREREKELCDQEDRLRVELALCSDAGRREAILQDLRQIDDELRWVIPGGIAIAAQQAVLARALEEVDELAALRERRAELVARIDAEERKSTKDEVEAAMIRGGVAHLHSEIQRVDVKISDIERHNIALNRSRRHSEKLMALRRDLEKCEADAAEALRKRMSQADDDFEARRAVIEVQISETQAEMDALPEIDLYTLSTWPHNLSNNAGQTLLDVANRIARRRSNPRLFV